EGGPTVIARPIAAAVMPPGVGRPAPRRHRQASQQEPSPLAALGAGVTAIAPSRQASNVFTRTQAGVASLSAPQPIRPQRLQPPRSQGGETCCGVPPRPSPP